MDELFAPPGSQWRRVSIKLRDVRRLVIVGQCTSGAIIGGVLLHALLGRAWLTTLFILVLVAAAGWGWVWAARNQANWGYAENDDDLVVTSGVMFKRLVAVPYGRMQFVDVSAGPIDRAFGIASVTLHTASTETASRIPGLLADDATRLRNRLTELGEAHGAGL